MGADDGLVGFEVGVLVGCAVGCDVGNLVGRFVGLINTRTINIWRTI